MKSRLTELDSFRGIAACMVMIEHYTHSYNMFYAPISWPFDFKYGGVGVQLFFMISGFVIYLTLNKTNHPYDFIISRFSRLFPAYWFAVLLTVAFISIFSLPDTLFTPGIYEVIVNLSMLQRWLKVENIDRVYWTLAVELSFYAIMFTIYLCGKLKIIEKLSIFYLFIIFLTKFFENYSGITILNVIKVTLLLDYGNLFIAGIMFYKIIHQSRVILILIIMFCLLAEYYLREETIGWVIVFFLLFFLFTKGFLKIISLKPLVYLGSISYSLYLTHQIIGYILINQLRKSGIENAWILLSTAILWSIILAGCIRHFIEKPGQQLIRNYYHHIFRSTKNQT